LGARLSMTKFFFSRSPYSICYKLATQFYPLQNSLKQTCKLRKWFYTCGYNACMLCVGMDNWETKLKGNAPYEGLVIYAFYVRVLTKDSSKFFF